MVGEVVGVSDETVGLVGSIEGEGVGLSVGISVGRFLIGNEGGGEGAFPLLVLVEKYRKFEYDLTKRYELELIKWNEFPWEYSNSFEFELEYKFNMDPRDREYSFP